MYSLNDFVDRRWADAKEALRSLAPGFVDEREKTAQLEAMGMSYPWTVDERRQPRKFLSTEWHKLLEACDELIFQASILQTAGRCLTAEVHKGMSPGEVGRQSAYHFRSWFIHANTLGERAEDVIRKTIAVYIRDETTRRDMTERYQVQVRERINKRVEKQRNQYAHGSIRSWSRGITEDHLWEGPVAVGLTPQKIDAGHVYPDKGAEVLRGKYAHYPALSEELCSILGEILRMLEAEVMSL